MGTLCIMKNKTFYIYGRKPIEEQLLHNSDNIMRIFISDRVAAGEEDINQIKVFSKEKRIPFNTVGHKKIVSHVGDVNDQGIIALLKTPPYVEFNEWIGELDLNKKHVVLVLDHVEDTHNYGAILRTAAAAGVTGVIVSKDRQAPLNGTVF